MILLNPDGSVRSPSEVVNTVTAGLQSLPSVASTDLGTLAVTYVSQAGAADPTGTLTMLDGNGLDLGDTTLSNDLGPTASRLPVAGGSTSSLLVAVTDSTMTQPMVSANEIAIQPLTILGTSQNDTVIVAGNVASLDITVNGVTEHPLLADFNEIDINVGLGDDTVIVADLLDLAHLNVHIDGGEGNDTMTSGDTDDTIIGVLSEMRPALTASRAT